MTDPVLFFLAVLTLLATPGPTNTVMATAGAAGGTGPLRLLLAELLGYLSIILLSRLALLPLIDLYPPAAWVLKLLVVGYLLYAAVRLWRDRITIAAGGAAIGPRLVFVTTLLNPKGLVLAIGVFPDQHPMLLAYFGLFAIVVISAGYAWFSAGRGLAAIAGNAASLLPRIAALALVGFAALLAASIGR